MSKLRKIILALVIVVLVAVALVLLLVVSNNQVKMAEARSNLGQLYQKSLDYYLRTSAWPQVRDWVELMTVLQIEPGIFATDEYLFCPSETGMTVAVVINPKLLTSGATNCYSNRIRYRQVNLDCQKTVDQTAALLCLSGK